MTIKDAARLVEIKYENAKAIYRVYRREQRTDKRKNRFRSKVLGGSDSFGSRKKGHGKHSKVGDSDDEDEDEEDGDSEM